MKKIVILFLCFANAVFASTDDSLKTSNKVFPLKYYTVNQFEYSDSVSYLLNTLHDFQNYSPRNTLGNSGLPLDNFIYSTNQPFGFNYCRNYYRNYFYSPYNLNFYNTRIPYTDLFCVFGSKKEQFFKMAFSFNVKKNWNITANFSRIKSLGFYQRQKTDDTFFALSSNYKTSDNRYMLLISGIVNVIKNEENGGMLNDSAFFAGRSTYNAMLGDAINFRLNKNIFLKQYLNLGHKINDTAPVITSSRFILTSTFDDFAQKYTDGNPSAGYYKNIYYDSIKTHDSTYVLKFENELAWKRVDNKKHRHIGDMIGLGAGLKHQYISVEQRNMDTIFNNVLSWAELSNLYTKNKFWWSLRGSYGVKGYNKNDYEISGLITKFFKDSLSSISLHVKSKMVEPDFIYNEYLSNHFMWMNEFDKRMEQSIAASLFLNRYDFGLDIDFTNYFNVLYFDTIAVPRQYKGRIPVFSASLNKNIEFHNWHLDNKINYQNVPDSSVIRVPQFILKHALYYENDLFKNAMRLQIGFQVFFNTSFYANAYMPATGQFYLQTEKKYGNYPVLDFFLNAKIKVVNIFFKIDHLNAGFSGNNYMLTPLYILNQRSFKVGVSWKFWD